MNENYRVTDEILKGADKSMSYLVKDNIIRLNFDELDDYEFPMDKPFGLQVIHNNTLYCLVARFSSKNKNLLCTGSGFQRRNRILYDGELRRPPFFDRWSWYNYFEESYISYSDPMMFYDDEITLGWFVGTKDEWYLNSLAEIFDKLARNQGILNDNILFFGSSGGGYASVVLATLLKNSKVIINNSQLFLLNYNDFTLDKLFSMLSVDFVGMSREEIIDQILYRLDIVELFKKENYAPFLTYYLNSDSPGDIKSHALPLLQKTLDSENYNGMEIIVYTETKEVPHEPLPIETTVEILRQYAKKYLYNSPEDKLKGDEFFIYNDDDNHVRRLDKDIEDLKDEIKALKDEKRDLLNSSSWKLTKPLRKVKQIVKKVLKK